MIKSMTGYGRAQQTIDNMEITAEIRAVNHRYFEFTARIPRQFAFLDDKLKAFVNRRVARGKVEVYITISMLDNDSTSVEVNVPLAKAYAGAFHQISVECGVMNDFSVSDIARFPDVLSVRKAQEDEDAVYEAVSKVLGVATDSFIKMRETEGERLKTDVLSRCDTILNAVGIIEGKSGETVNAYREKLEAKVRELLNDVQIDEQRLLTETAVFADKIAVDEETVRLKSHVDQMRILLNSAEPTGRKIDFLVQEMNREANTIGSKCSNIEVTRIVVDIKSEIEKIREQIQNIE